MGDETTQRTKQLLLESLRNKAQKKIDTNIEFLKEENPFLNGVKSISDAIVKGQIECRVYNKTKFHAKTYITHPKLDIIGTKALVGSSNFTKPGLSQNVELNVQIQSQSDVLQRSNAIQKRRKRGRKSKSI